MMEEVWKLISDIIKNDARSLFSISNIY
jgi:hypothetical protein